MNSKFIQFLGLCKRAGKLLEGYNKCEDGIKRKKVSLVMISKFVSVNTNEKFTRLCEQNGIRIIKDFDRDEIEKIIGTPEINVIGVTDPSMSKELIKLWKELI